MPGVRDLCRRRSAGEVAGVPGEERQLLRPLESVINFRAGGVLPQHMRAGDPIAREIAPDRGPRGLRPWGGDEAESEGCGRSTVESDNKVWRDFHRNPKGWGQFSSFRCRSSLEDSRYSSLLTPGTEKNWLPAPPAGKLITGSSFEEKPPARQAAASR